MKCDEMKAEQLAVPLIGCSFKNPAIQSHTKSLALLALPYITIIKKLHIYITRRGFSITFLCGTTRHKRHKPGTIFDPEVQFGPGTTFSFLIIVGHYAMESKIQLEIERHSIVRTMISRFAQHSSFPYIIRSYIVITFCVQVHILVTRVFGLSSLPVKINGKVDVLLTCFLPNFFLAQ